jgi:hypothetical protein
MLSEVTSSMTSDRESFQIEMELDVTENDEKVFSRKWTFTLPRDNV